MMTTYVINKNILMTLNGILADVRSREGDDIADELLCDATGCTLALTIVGDRGVDGKFMLIDTTNRYVIIPNFGSTTSKNHKRIERIDQSTTLWATMSYNTTLSNITSNSQGDITGLTSVIAMLQADDSVRCMSNNLTLNDAVIDVMRRAECKNIVIIESNTCMN